MELAVPTSYGCPNCTKQFATFDESITHRRGCRKRDSNTKQFVAGTRILDDDEFYEREETW